MASTINSISVRVRGLIKDSTKTRWTDAEIIDWVNDAQREIVRLSPSAYMLTVIRQLVSGTRQSLALLGITDGHAVVDVTCNVSATGVYGRAINKIDRAMLDAQYPMWSSYSGVEVLNWAPNSAAPKEFYTYPALRDLGGKVEVVYAAVPPVLTAIEQDIALDDLYTPAVGYYVAFRVYSKDIESSANKDIAASYLALFNQFFNKG